MTCSACGGYGVISTVFPLFYPCPRCGEVEPIPTKENPMIAPTIATVTVSCQSPECVETEEVEVSELQLSDSIESLVEAAGWGWFMDARCNSTFVCGDCLERLQAAEEVA